MTLGLQAASEHLGQTRYPTSFSHRDPAPNAGSRTPFLNNHFTYDFLKSGRPMLWTAHLSDLRTAGHPQA
jgi:hypothetical protein